MAQLLLLFAIFSASLTLSAGGSDYETLLEGLFARYDNSIPPNHSAVVVEVTGNVTLSTGVDSVKQQFGLTVLLNQMWVDHRLSWTPGDYGNITEVPLGYGSRLPWKPSAHFVQSVASPYDSKLQEERFTLHSTGRVALYQRVVTVLSCAMDFTWWPFDEQHCRVEVNSLDSFVRFMAGIQSIGTRDSGNNLVGAYRLDTIDVAETLGKPQQSVHWSITFKHQSEAGRYFLTTFVPLWLVVGLSCLGLWLNPEAAPARVTMAITAVLVLISLQFVLTKEIPTVSYLTAMDVYFLNCLVFVAANVGEYGLINNLLWRLKVRQRKLCDRNHHMKTMMRIVVDAAAEPGGQICFRAASNNTNITRQKRRESDSFVVNGDLFKTADTSSENSEYFEESVTPTHPVLNSTRESLAPPDTTGMYLLGDKVPEMRRTDSASSLDSKASSLRSSRRQSGISIASRGEARAFPGVDSPKEKTPLKRKGTVVIPLHPPPPPPPPATTHPNFPHPVTPHSPGSASSDNDRSSVGSSVHPPKEQRRAVAKPAVTLEVPQYTGQRGKTKGLIQTLGPAQLAELREAFSVLDTDLNGKISTDELAPVLMSMGVPPEDIQFLIDTYDTNNSGTIEFEEFVEMMMIEASKLNITHFRESEAKAITLFGMRGLTKTTVLAFEERYRVVVVIVFLVFNIAWFSFMLS
eukprot:Sspe_Gene.23565::Locus_9152_Transcript_1_1_Confidence_1.000_Length_2408::g.23565::m.23565/K05181/GABRB; gamma-aminobutyric acid receptor subunit beta